MMRFLLLVLLIMQSAAAQAPADGREVPGEPPVLTVVTPYGDAAFAWLETQLDTWAETTGHSVEIRQLPLGELLRQAVPSDEGPEPADLLVGVPHDGIRELVSAGLLLDLSAWTTPGYRADLPAAALSAFDYGEGLAGLPLAVSGPALLVNTDLAGAEPADYAAFIAEALRSRRAGSGGFIFDFTNFYLAWAWFRAHGTELFGAAPAGMAEPPEVTLFSPEALEGLQALHDLRFRSRLLEGASAQEPADTLFASGRLAYTFSGPWSVAAAAKNGIPVEVRNMPPAVPGVPFAGFMTVDGILVGAGAADPGRAVNAAKWLARPAAQADLALSAGFVPPEPAALADAGEQAALLAGFSRALEHADPVPVAAAMNGIWPLLGELLAELDRRPRTAQQLAELLDGAAQAFQDGTDDGRQSDLLP